MILAALAALEGQLFAVLVSLRLLCTHVQPSPRGSPARGRHCKARRSI